MEKRDVWIKSIPMIAFSMVWHPTLSNHPHALVKYNCRVQLLFWLLILTFNG